MKTLFLRFLFVAILASTIALIGAAFTRALAGTPQYHVVSINVPGEPATPRHLFYYYPDTRVYYDPDNTVYYWQKGGHWAAGARLPSDLLLIPGQRVVIDTNVGKPYAVDNSVVMIPTSEYYYHDPGTQVVRYYRPPNPYRSSYKYYREYPRRYDVYPPYWYYRASPVEIYPRPSTFVYRDYPYYYRYYPGYGRDYNYYRFYPFYPRYPHDRLSSDLYYNYPYPGAYPYRGARKPPSDYPYR